MDRDFVNFRALYDELTDEVERASHTYFPDHLERWFEHLDETPAIAPTIHRLQDGLDFASWYKEQEQNKDDDEGVLRYPAGRDNALGMRLLLFRAIAEKRLEGFQVAYSFAQVAGNVNELNRSLIDQLFSPMARELRRYLEREAQKADDGVPASDRVVNLKHNHVSYQEAIEALDKLEQLLREANDYEDANDKDQKIAEVSATKRLLQAVRVRVSAVIGLIQPTLRFLSKTFAMSGIGKAASWAWDKIIALFV